MSNRQPKGGMIAARQSVMSYEGPLPPAAEFERYERTHPGVAAKIIEWSEKEAEHRRTSESQIINTASKLSFRGQYFAFTIALLSLVATVLCALLDKQLAAIVPAVLGCVSLAAVFIQTNK